MNVDSFRSLLGLLEENYTLHTVLISLTEMMIKEIAKSKNINLLKYFMISYNPNMIFENIWKKQGIDEVYHQRRRLKKLENEWIGGDDVVLIT